MSEREPININEHRRRNLYVQERDVTRNIAALFGVLGEIRMEIQRIESGQKPHDLSAVVSSPLQSIRERQAASQSDAKSMQTSPPYENLLQ